MTSYQSIFKIPLLARYFAGAYLYGFVHTVAHSYDSHKLYYQKSTASYVQKQKLLADKLSSVAMGTICAPIIWPLMLGQDLAGLECAVQGKDPEEYGA